MPKPLNVGLLVAPGYALCDVVGPQTVFGIQPDVKIYQVWKNLDLVDGEPSFLTKPTATFAECPDLDVIALGAAPGEVVLDPEVIEFVGTAARRAQHVIAVCGGVIIAGMAGLLEGKRASTNFQSISLLPHFGAEAVEGGKVVRDGNLWTAGPASGSYEAALLVLAELRGEDAARRTELDIEYAPHPPFGTGSPELAGPELTHAALSVSTPAIAAFGEMLAERRRNLKLGV